MIISGKDIAERVYACLPKETRKLGIIVAELNPVIESFVKIKEQAAKKLGVELVRVALPSGVKTEEAISEVRSLAQHVDGIIVQLPLPKTIEVESVLAAIPSDKDVDGISQAPRVRPPVAEAVREILQTYSVSVAGARAVVVGSGKLVGKPSADLLREMGAAVTVVGKGDSLTDLKTADIVVLGAGEPGLVTANLLKEGVVLIDAGTSEAGGKVRGDADPECSNVASLFTPVPGGVGPIAVAMIFKNLYTLSVKE